MRLAPPPRRMRSEPPEEGALTRVMVNGKLLWACSVCGDRIGTRSELDSSGRCDECRP